MNTASHPEHKDVKTAKNQKSMGPTILDELGVLKEQFDRLKTETEEFIASAKHLSDRGTHEAKELMDAAKENWHSIVQSFETSSIGKFFAKGKKAAPKRVLTKAKKVVRKVAKTAKSTAKSKR